MPTDSIVLIADNDPGVALVLQQVLASAGIVNVESVADGTAALARLERGDVSLLICDLDMPGVSGEELVARGRDESDGPAVGLPSGSETRES